MKKKITTWAIVKYILFDGNIEIDWCCEKYKWSFLNRIKEIKILLKNEKKNNS